MSRQPRLEHVWLLKAMVQIIITVASYIKMEQCFRSLPLNDHSFKNNTFSMLGSS